mmetsp:Transcript_101654/g.285583  ORF Transcript_101654/g.285583 Transcript_101654/m.285583 type:complete len:701 (+) Transcript_101654:63-2165(+)
MKAVLALGLALSAGPWAAGAESTNPLAKVIVLIDGLNAKIVADGEEEAKLYHEYMEWCNDASQNANFAVESATKQQAKLEAKLGEYSSEIAVASTQIEELAAAISSTEADLKKATEIRDKESTDFGLAEKELMEGVDTMAHAISALEKEMAKNPAALAQVDTSNAAAALKAVSTVLEAAALSSSDHKKLAALLQAQHESEDEDGAPGAPAPDAYKSQSGGIVEILEDMKDKAESQLSDLRKAESTTKHNYNLMKQSLDSQKAADTKDMDDQKAAMAEAEEAKATAEGDLEVTVKDLKNSASELAGTRGACMRTAADHEATVAARAEELKVVAQARQILVETSGGATAQSYSLLQVSAGTGNTVASMVKSLARKYHSSALAQLSSRIASIAKYGAGNHEDPFGKVKGMIQSMIEKLEGEANEEATEKSYCDEEMQKSEAKKGELETDVEKMTTKVDQAAAKSAQLQEQVKVLEGELAALTKEQAEMDSLRMEQHDAYVTAKADLEKGLGGVRTALQLLRDYYTAKDASLLQDDGFGAFMQQPAAPVKHEKSSGAGGSIIGILEVVESDFATNLAKEESQEADATSEYDKVSQDNKIAMASKEQDVKFKEQESKSLDNTVAEVSTDRQASSSELQAVLEYYAKIKDRCIAKPETFEERQKRRTGEIEGLKKALEVLEGETAFVQRKHHGRRHHFRGSALTAN